VLNASHPFKISKLNIVILLQESTGVSDGDFVSYVNEWCKDGAVLIGGCCRTTPNTIRAIHRTLNKSPNKQQLPAVE
jgi:hypothetical protein